MPSSFAGSLVIWRTAMPLARSIPRTPVSKTMMLLKEREDDWTDDRYRGCVSVAPTTQDHLPLSNPLRARIPADQLPILWDAERERARRPSLLPRRQSPAPASPWGKSAKNSARDCPRSRYSNSVCTGTRVPANTGVPLKIPGSTWMTVAPRFISFRIHLRSGAANEAGPVRATRRRSAP